MKTLNICLPEAFRNFQSTKHFFLFAAILILLSACKKDEKEDEIIDTLAERVYIINEGNFQAGNSSVTLLIPDSSIVEQDYFKSVNSVALGDIAMSMAEDENHYYIIVNNSSKIEVLDKSNFKRVATITGLLSPRHMVIHNSKAYVSDLFLDGLYVVDLNSRTVTKEIHTGGWTEQMVLKNNELFVTNVSKDYLYVVNTSTDAVTDSIFLDCGAGSIVEDNSGNLWVLCSGSSWAGTDAKLLTVNPGQKTVTQSFPFPSGVSGVNGLNYLPETNEIAYVSEDVYKMSVTASALPSQSFIPSSDKSVYGLFVHPQHHSFWILDAKDFTSQGEVFVYSKEGVFENSLNTGVLPSFVFFAKK